MQHCLEKSRSCGSRGSAVSAMGVWGNMQSGMSGDSEISWDGEFRVREPSAIVDAVECSPGSMDMQDLQDFRRNSVGGRDRTTPLHNGGLRAAGVTDGELADPRCAKAAPLLPRTRTTYPRSAQGCRFHRLPRRRALAHGRNAGRGGPAHGGSRRRSTSSSRRRPGRDGEGIAGPGPDRR